VQLACGILLQQRQQIALIKPGEALFEFDAARFKQQRCRHHHGCIKRRAIAILPQQTGQHIAAQRYADGGSGDAAIIFL